MLSVEKCGTQNSNWNAMKKIETLELNVNFREEFNLTKLFFDELHDVNISIPPDLQFYPYRSTFDCE